MATSRALRLLFRSRECLKCSKIHHHQLHTNARSTLSNFSIGHVTSYAVVGSAISYFIYKKHFTDSNDAAVSESNQNEEPVVYMNQRMKRFAEFASVRYDGVIFMTPHDFLQSVLDDSPRVRSKHYRLSQREYENVIKGTPNKKSANDHFLRNLGDAGLISYSEYLFLLCLITKPRSGYEVAFSMFDEDGNHKINKQEFLVVYRLISSQFGAIKPTHSGLSMIEDSEFYPETTLLIHFFGRKGDGEITFDEFSTFIENLQTEILHAEFMRFSRGMKTISESEFAHSLLKHTNINKTEYNKFVQRIKDTTEHEKGISFPEFKKFFQFLNNLDDFTIAMKLFSYANRPISQVEFQRAVKACVGYNLDEAIVESLFTIFDADGDGHLSQHEFICMMKDRLTRGLSKKHLEDASRWDQFRHCVSHNLSG